MSVLLTHFVSQKASKAAGVNLLAYENTENVEIEVFNDESKACVFFDLAKKNGSVVTID